MAFIKHKGKTVTRWLPVTTSTTFTKGDIAAWSSGLLVKGTTTSAAKTHVGIIQKTIAATDADYAVARLVPVLVPVERMVEWRAPATAIVAADIGLWLDLGSAGAVGSTASSTYDAVQVKGVISATEGIFILNLGGAVETIN